MAHGEWPVSEPPTGETMDHDEAARKFERLLLREADHWSEAAIELEALIPGLRVDNARQLAELQLKEFHKQAKSFRELAQKAKSR